MRIAEDTKFSKIVYLCILQRPKDNGREGDLLRAHPIPFAVFPRIEVRMSLHACYGLQNVHAAFVAQHF